MMENWSSVTTRLLCEGGGSSWNVIDQVLSDDADCDALQNEIDSANLVEKLQPAKTTGESQLAELLGVTSLLSDRESPPTNVRGDKSIFLSREYRNKPNFQTNHPCLHKFTSLVTETCVNKLQHHINFDLSLTSVQLAIYPGDNRSGYPRHCDRSGFSNSCIEESDSRKNIEIPQPTARQQLQSLQRIVTAVYYLTDDDWNEELDGGHLRVFASSSSSSSSSSNDDALDNKDEKYHDVIPYRNRLVVFRSDGVSHQVLPSKRRQRMALTVWMYGNLKEDNGGNVHKKAKKPADSNNEITTKKYHKEESLSSASDQASIVATCAAVTKQHEGLPPLQVPSSLLEDNHNSNGIKTVPIIPTIFVSIASYRDSETVPTISALFATATNPQHVVVGLVLQLLDDDEYDKKIRIQLMEYQKQYPDHQIRVLYANAIDSTGPCNARAQCQTLHRGEDYIMQIDSHMRFRQNWDRYLIELHQYESCNLSSPNKVVLTAYPVGYQLPNQIPNETRGTHLVRKLFVRQKKGLVFNSRHILVYLSSSLNLFVPLFDIHLSMEI